MGVALRGEKAGRAWRSVWTGALATGLGLWLRVWFIVQAPRVTGDSLIYGDIAKNLLRHGVYGFSLVGGGVKPTLLRLPGYPLFLAACFSGFGMEHYRAVMLVQAVLDVATCGLVAGVARRLYGNRAGWAALWLGMLCPFTANYTGAALTETLSLLCVGGAFYGLTRWNGGMDRWVGVMSAALAYAVLLRPEQGLLAVAVVGAMAGMCWRARGAWGPVVVTAVLVVLPLGPWAVRNWVTFHVVQPLAPRNANDPGEAVPVGFERWYRTWGVDFISTDQVYWHYDSDPIRVEDLPDRAFDSTDQRERTAALLADYNQTTTATVAFDARFAALARERITGHRLRYWISLPLARLANMLLRPRIELLVWPLDWWRQRGAEFWGPVLFGLANLGYLGLAGWGVWKRGLGGAGWAMMAFCVLRCALLATIDNSEPRYTLELFPALIVWGAGVWRRGVGV